MGKLGKDYTAGSLCPVLQYENICHWKSKKVTRTTIKAKWKVSSSGSRRLLGASLYCKKNSHAVVWKMGWKTELMWVQGPRSGGGCCHCPEEKW